MVPFEAAVRTTSLAVESVAVIVDPPKTASFIVAVILISAPRAKLPVAAASTEVLVNSANKALVVSLYVGARFAAPVVWVLPEASEKAPSRTTILSGVLVAPIPSAAKPVLATRAAYLASESVKTSAESLVTTAVASPAAKYSRLVPVPSMSQAIFDRSIRSVTVASAEPTVRKPLPDAVIVFALTSKAKPVMATVGATVSIVRAFGSVATFVLSSNANVAVTLSLPCPIAVTSAAVTATVQSPLASTVAVLPPASVTELSENDKVTTFPTLPRPLIAKPSVASARLIFSSPETEFIVTP